MRSAIAGILDLQDWDSFDDQEGRLNEGSDIEKALEEYSSRMVEFQERQTQLKRPFGALEARIGFIFDYSPFEYGNDNTPIYVTMGV